MPVVSEFMVEEHELQKEKIQEDYNDKYWDQRYTIVQHRIPSFLQKMADKILSTGLNMKMDRDNIRGAFSRSYFHVFLCREVPERGSGVWP